MLFGWLGSISSEPGCFRDIGFTVASLSADQSGQRDGRWGPWEEPLMEESMFTAALHHRRGTMVVTSTLQPNMAAISVNLLSVVLPLLLWPVLFVCPCCSVYLSKYFSDTPPLFPYLPYSNCYLPLFDLLTVSHSM